MCNTIIGKKSLVEACNVLLQGFSAFNVKACADVEKQSLFEKSQAKNFMYGFC